jgi:AcrR family transcriptional regulator
MTLKDQGSDPDADAPRRRRRGEDLEVALLDAVWEEFRATGYDGLTVEAVARRAGTSRAVLYRRWPGKVEMVAAAARHAVLSERGPAPEPTGSLRDDLVNLLSWANRTDVRTMVEATTHVGAYLARSGLSFSDVRDLFLQAKPSSAFSPIAAAVERGEIDPSVVTPRVASLAFDLFRHEVLINAQPLTDETIREIVDDIALPLLTRRFPPAGSVSDAPGSPAPGR